MSSGSAETFFDYEAGPDPVDSGVIDSIGFENVVYLHPQDDQDQETGIIAIDETDEEIYHLEVDNNVSTLNKDPRSTYERLSAEQERQLLVRAKTGDLQAQNQLVGANRWIVLYLAQRLQKPGVDLDELIQAGYLALWRAIEKKDIYSECRLSTYAYKPIRWSMLLVVDKAQSISKLTQDGFDDTTLGDLAIDYRAEDAIERVIPRLEIAQATAGLSDREKEALVRRFGLGDKLHVIGKEMNPQSSRTRVGYEMSTHRLVNKAIKKMRKDASQAFTSESAEY